MNWVNMHVLNGLWAGTDELGMVCVWIMVGWFVVYWHEIGMHDYSMIGWWDMILVLFRA